MLFSVVVPVYNAEKYIQECIDSILAQTYTDFELILVNDGSSDNSGKICDEYATKDDRIKVIHKKNEGSVFARRDGAIISKGEYILIVDSDDYISKELLAKADSIIGKYNPDIIAYNANYVLKDSAKEIRNFFDEGLYTGVALEKVKSSIIYDKTQYGIVSGVLYSLWSKIIKRNLLIKYQKNVPKNIRKGDDLAVTAPIIANCSSIYFFDSAEYHYRYNYNSIMNSFSCDEMKSCKTLCGYLDNIMGEVYRNQISVFVLYSSRDYIVSAARQFDTYKKYKEFINITIDNDIVKRIREAKVYKPTKKDRIIIFMLKHRIYYFFYKRFHIK